MPTIQGPGGAVDLPASYNIAASGWSADLTLETVDVSSFGDNGYRVRKGAIMSMDGSVTGTVQGGSSTPVPVGLVADPMAPASAEGTITLTAEAGNTYSFPGIVTGVSMNRTIDGKMDMTVSFQSAGKITQAWA